MDGPRDLAQPETRQHSFPSFQVDLTAQTANSSWRQAASHHFSKPRPATVGKATAEIHSPPSVTSGSCLPASWKLEACRFHSGASIHPFGRSFPVRRRRDYESAGPPSHPPGDLSCAPIHPSSIIPLSIHHPTIRTFLAWSSWFSWSLFSARAYFPCPALSPHHPTDQLLLVAICLFGCLEDSPVYGLLLSCRGVGHAPRGVTQRLVSPWQQLEQTLAECPATAALVPP